MEAMIELQQQRKSYKEYLYIVGVTIASLVYTLRNANSKLLQLLIARSVSPYRMEILYRSWLMKSPPEKKAYRLFRPVSSARRIFSIANSGSAHTS